VADINNIYRCGPRQTQALIEEILFAGLVPFVRSSPGMGKSSLFRNVTRIANLHMIDHRASTSDPTDFSGLPNFDANGMARFAPFSELFPLQSTPLPKGKDGWLIFLDEYNAASKQVRAAAFKLILDRMIGQHPLHERVAIGLAGNLDTDRSITTAISTAEQSRLIHIEMMIVFNEWLTDVALKEDYDPRIIAFLSQYESYLMDFKPSHTERTFCCPRTWEFMNALVKGKDVTDSKAVLYAGTITSLVAVEFVQFCQIWKKVINIRQIINDPKGCEVPQDVNLKWATVGHMMDKIEDSNFADLATYANRFSLDFRVLFYRSTMVRHKHLRRHPDFINGAIELSKYLHD